MIVAPQFTNHLTGRSWRKMMRDLMLSARCPGANVGAIWAYGRSGKSTHSRSIRAIWVIMHITTTYGILCGTKHKATRPSSLQSMTAFPLSGGSHTLAQYLQ